MPLDFDKLLTGSSVDTVFIPSEIFRALPAKKTKYTYLRDVQSEVLDQWFTRRAEKDLVIKMNTGSGKTLVGLLLLKSCINEGKFPAFYVAPDSYLVKQVMKEAGELGIAVTDDPRSPAIQRGQAVGVINIYKLVNGLSVFGVSPNPPEIPISSIVIDDAHACLSAAESQFTLVVDSGIVSEAYERLFELFKSDLSHQCEVGAIELESNDPLRNMLVPYWAWINKQKEVIKILHGIRDSDSIKFVWPLIKDQLSLCQCVFGGGKIEISPKCIPINAIPSFIKASRKVYMSATLGDDSVLVSNFDIDPAATEKPITPKIANDIGDRMILIPQDLFPLVKDDEIKAFLTKQSAKYNVVVIVPSNYRAQYWSDVAARVLIATNLYEGIKELHEKHVGLVVLVNKYDGIDLPDDACRILVIDGLPDVRRKIDIIDQTLLLDSEIVSHQKIQRIEQGMGRGIRANDDYCVVFLMGATLVSSLYAMGAQRFFSLATKAQIDLSSKVAEQIRGKSLIEIEEIINYCLSKNPQWLKVSRGALVNLKYIEQVPVDLITRQQRLAFDFAHSNQHEQAVNAIQLAVNDTQDETTRGWLKMQLAEYKHYVDPVESQQILKSALVDNPRVLKPLEGIVFNKLVTTGLDQAKRCLEFMQKQAADPNKFILYLNGTLDEVRFRPESYRRFEKAMKDLAEIIGYIGQRPEVEFGKGSDVLWGVGEMRYFIISCKNEATTDIICKRDCDQLSGAVNWFDERYDRSCQRTPIMIHLSSAVEFETTPNAEMRVIDADKLNLLKSAVSDFATSVLSSGDNLNVANINKLLVNYNLIPDKFLNTFTIKYKNRER